jgi:glycosyltransferase involved in cell wall biosynthesis
VPTNLASPSALSVVIPCFNEAAFVGGLLDDLSRQSHLPGQVVVVDSQSSDATTEVAAAHSSSLPLTVVPAPRGVAHARNAGAASATHDWLLFLDADVRLPPRFLEDLVDDVRVRGASLATTNFRAPGSSARDKVAVWVGLKYCRAFARSKHPVVGGFCVLCSREIFSAAGGFDPRVRMGEDLDFASRAMKAGARFAFVARTSLFYNLRRYRDEGFLRLASKNLAYEVFRRARGFDVVDSPFDYTFDGYSGDR